MQDGEIQRELLSETRMTKKALEVTKNIEMGFQNQMKISGSAAYTDSNQIANASVNSLQILSTLCQHVIVKLAQQGEKLQKLWNHKSFCENSSQDKKSNKTEPKGQ